MYKDCAKGDVREDDMGNKVELEGCIKNFASPEVLRG